jgi:hypothetical protein
VREIGGIHLRVARHHHGDIRAELESSAVSADDRTTDARVHLMADHDDPRVRGAPRDLGGAVAALVVHDDDVVHEVGHREDDLGDELLFVVGRHHGGNAMVLVHDGPSPRASPGRPRRL